jgi:hypothetical protein
MVLEMCGYRRPRPVRHEYLTLFDSRYLARGLVLQRSLADFVPTASLHVVCMDAATKRLLDRLRLPRVRTMNVEELEAFDPALASVRPSRTVAEYCWTAKASACLFALETDQALDAVTYLDADLMFYSGEGPLLDSLGSGSILLVPHRFVPRFDFRSLVGEFNAGTVTFRRGETALTALRWWRDRCLEWCYRRFEDGKYTDQKYLDDWPARFGGVRVAANPGIGLAPWNSTRYRLERSGAKVLVDDSPLVFYHHHSLKLYRGLDIARRFGLLSDRYRYARVPNGLVWTALYLDSTSDQQLIWEPYLTRLQQAIDEIKRLEPDFDDGFERVSTADVLAQIASDYIRRPIAKQLAGVAQRLNLGGSSVRSRARG